MKIFILFFLISNQAYSQTRLVGKDCQICQVDNGIRVCQYHTPCPLDKETDNNDLNQIRYNGQGCSMTIQNGEVTVSKYFDKCPVRKTSK